MGTWLLLTPEAVAPPGTRARWGWGAAAWDPLKSKTRPVLGADSLVSDRTQGVRVCF